MTNFLEQLLAKVQMDPSAVDDPIVLMTNVLFVVFLITYVLDFRYNGTILDVKYDERSLLNHGKVGKWALKVIELSAVLLALLDIIDFPFPINPLFLLWVVAFAIPKIYYVITSSTTPLTRKNSTVYFLNQFSLYLMFFCATYITSKYAMGPYAGELVKYDFIISTIYMCCLVFEVVGYYFYNNRE